MAPSKLRQAIGAVKDQTSISLAKVGGSSSLSDLEVAIVKATRHEEFPAEERHIREILSLTSYSRAHVSACVTTLSKRLRKTKNWVVALKSLMLVQRLLAEGDPAYEQEIFFATRRGTRFLNLSDFRDTSRTNSWDYSAFVRTYALYLDERLAFRMQGRRRKRGAFGFEDEEDSHRRVRRSSYGFEEDEEKRRREEEAAKGTPLQEMKTEIIFSRIQHMHQLLERFLACKPTGSAKHHRVIIVALYPILKESFQLYYDIEDILAVLIDRFMELEIPDSVKVHEIFYRTSKQFEELDMFYKWCRDIGIARSSEYPDIEQISQKKLDLMDEFIRDRSALAQCKKNKSQEKDTHEKEKEHENTEDMNAMKALPAPEDVKEEEEEEEEKKEEPKQEEEKKEEESKEADLLNLGEDVVSNESHANSLALALFDGLGPATSNSSTTPALAWHAFDDAEDWETALVQTASNLPGQKPTHAGGFDMLMLDGMYHQAATNQAVAQSGAYGSASGSASSVAFGSAGMPAMLALPAPLVPNGQAMQTTGTIQADPFAPSLVVPPPSYVQMSEMEKKQKFLVEEQMMWQRYARDRMQGQAALDKLQNNYTYSNNSYNYYNMGGYGRSY